MVGRQVGSHLEGLPFYGQRNDFSPSEIDYRYAGSKCINSESVFMGSSRDCVPQIRPDFQENSHLIKVLLNIRQEQLKRPHEAETFIAANLIRPSSKCERAIPVNVGPVLQYPPRVGQAVTYAYQHFRIDLKMPISSNVNGGVVEPTIGKHKYVIGVPEPGSSSPLRQWPNVDQHRQGSTSTSHQMTIFSGGQAHVFDDVHPKKSADAIMALVGSTGGSWSTSYSNATIKPTGGETISATGENSSMAAGNSDLPRGRLYVVGCPCPRAGSNDRMSLLHGEHGGVLMADARRTTTRAATKSSTEEKL
ncbi:hypothetical protein L6452_28265 [Arctium lappa]|uniref:Uncharacterized protein n=1 Tax=Arctium lappa TaxID=4217 RepID=A0ACB8ZYH5_ARCLA|nr:hypothetical protein L6452_28265 [Arctium lappa]